MPIESEPLVDYQVTTTHEGEYVHVTAEADPDNPRTHRWLWRPYAAEEGLFTQDTARQFFGVTCGMSERTRNRVVDQIDFTIAEDPDPDTDQTDQGRGKVTPGGRSSPGRLDSGGLHLPPESLLASGILAAEESPKPQPWDSSC